MSIIECLPPPHFTTSIMFKKCFLATFTSDEKKKKRNPFHDSVSSGYHRKPIQLLNLIKVKILSQFISTKRLDFHFMHVLKAGLDIEGVFT